MSGITTRQNELIQLDKLAAQRQIYATAKLVIGTQLILGGLVSVVLAFLGFKFPAIKNGVALWGLTVLIMDLVFLTPYQKRLRQSAAQIQEDFDCDVLQVPWHELKAGKKPDRELISEQAKKYARWAHRMPPLSDWYSICIQPLPLHWGRIVCQRTNCWWDSKLRRRYAFCVGLTLSILAIIFGWYSFSVPMTLEDAVIKIFIPLAPIFTVGYRQIVEHREAADRLDKLKLHAEKLWSEALAGASLAKMQTDARALQDEIFDGRKRNPPIFDILFRWLRNDQEDLMNKGAEALVVEALKKVRPYK